MIASTEVNYTKTYDFWKIENLSNSWKESIETDDDIEDDEYGVEEKDIVELERELSDIQFYGAYEEGNRSCLEQMMTRILYGEFEINMSRLEGNISDIGDAEEVMLAASQKLTNYIYGIDYTEETHDEFLKGMLDELSTSIRILNGMSTQTRNWFGELLIELLELPKLAAIKEHIKKLNN